MAYSKNDVSNAAYKLGRLVNGGVIGYYAGGKTSEVMSRTMPQKIVDVVEKHKKIQLGASLAQCLIPGAGVAAMAAAVASIWKMYYDINNVLGIKISENAGKSITSAVLTNFGSFGAKSVATAVSEGVKVIPGIGWVASAAITHVSTTAIIYGSASLYLNALTKMYEVEGKFDIGYLKSALSTNIYSSSSDTAKKVRKIIADILGVDYENVLDEASFTNDLGADSLDVVELIMEFEKKFKISIPDDQAKKIITVGDAIKYIENNK